MPEAKMSSDVMSPDPILSLPGVAQPFPLPHTTQAMDSDPVGHQTEPEDLDEK